ncbi:MAG: YraN family protein [Kiritimatiellia bacterium]
MVMSVQPRQSNIGVVHGAWGEDVAAEYLRIHGYEIVERNSRPCCWDARREIDIVAYDRQFDIMVFVEVKQHRTHSERAHRLMSISRRKKILLRTACRAWLYANRWQGAHRFDVIEIYGQPDRPGKVEIDHIERVKLFEKQARFVDWAE